MIRGVSRMTSSLFMRSSVLLENKYLSSGMLASRGTPLRTLRVSSLIRPPRITVLPSWISSEESVVAASTTGIPSEMPGQKYLVHVSWPRLCVIFSPALSRQHAPDYSNRWLR